MTETKKEELSEEELLKRIEESDFCYLFTTKDGKVTASIECNENLPKKMLSLICSLADVIGSMIEDIPQKELVIKNVKAHAAVLAITLNTDEFSLESAIKDARETGLELKAAFKEGKS